MRVIIAGGGIVGLSAGAALRRAGAEVVVSEQAEEIRAAGASIGLWTNALEVFGAIGIREPIEALGTGISTWFFDAAGRPHRAVGSTEQDHAFLLVPRPELNQTLADAVGRENIVLRSRVVGFAEDADGVTVRFADGSEDRADRSSAPTGSTRRSASSCCPAPRPTSTPATTPGAGCCQPATSPRAAAF